MTPSAPSIGAFLWLLVILFSLMLYVVLDGYDLGVGVLLLFERDDTRSKAMMELIATSWDGNESWLVLVGMGLFAGFPLAYSTLLPALYVPVILMLLALIFRGVSFEFQAQARVYRRGPSRAFAVGSLVDGIPVTGGHFSGTPFGFLQGFSLLTGVLFVCLYSLTGASWLNDKTVGALAARAKQQGRIFVVVVAMLLVVTMILAPLSSPVFARTLNTQLFFVIGATFLAALLSLLVINYPYLVPPSVTIWQAASPSLTVDFLLIAVFFCIPIVLGYNAFAYYVFRGKFTLPEQRKA